MADLTGECAGQVHGREEKGEEHWEPATGRHRLSRLGGSTATTFQTGFKVTDMLATDHYNIEYPL